MSRTIGWGYFMQGNERTQEIDRYGVALNNAINCPVHYPAFGKRIFECKCGVTFPVWMVEAAVSSNGWDLIEERHRGGQ